MTLFLLNLPQVIAIEVLCEWCELKDVMQVDSAFCNKTERSELLKQFQALEFITAHEVNSRRVLKYLMLRSMEVLSIGNRLKECCLIQLTITHPWFIFNTQVNNYEPNFSLVPLVIVSALFAKHLSLFCYSLTTLVYKRQTRTCFEYF